MQSPQLDDLTLFFMPFSNVFCDNIYVIMRVCRLCLHQEPENLISVLGNKDVMEKIKLYVSIEITDNDDLPTTACNSCVEKINDWSVFIDNCTKTNEVLLNLIQKGQFLNESRSQHDFKYLLQDEKRELFEVG
nr:PREDICTED: uncharacterized protein LOC107399232 [Tribolium castaneum]|eukprot:XP_015840639.1 PREDICTED: uncharacterized protein LOC107399232 [Tribolium castaneum]